MRLHVVWLPVLAGHGIVAAAADPAVSDLKADEVLVFFPTVGVPAPEGDAWDCRVHGWVYEPRSKEVSLQWLWSSFGLVEKPTDENSRALRSKRAGLFLVDNERGKHVVIRLDGRVIALGASEANGHCGARFRLTAAEVAKLRDGGEGGPVRPVRFEALLPEGDAREFSGALFLLPPAGLSVISDIDDTIKVTEIRDKKATVRNTFLEEFRPVRGMAELYQKWAEYPGAAFHYVSCSPWQLYDALEEFRRSAGFPAGSFHLKVLRLKDHSLFDFFDAPEAHKRAVIDWLLESCPTRRFILVGDSGQDDPEIYGEVARRHPGRIVRIFIRNVTDQPREHERYAKAFRDLPVAQWGVFWEPAEVPVLIP